MRLINGFLNPQAQLVKLMRKMNFALPTKIAYDLFQRPNYAYCMYYAALSARRLKIDRITAIEFGVAGGRGIIAMEKLAAEIEKATGVGFDIVGFDTGEGLPDPVDYRDLPYIWQGGFFKMDKEKLLAQLSRAEVVFGDVADTVPTFLANQLKSPVGVCFFDLDYHSSTKNSLAIFSPKPEQVLPRVYCYFDDVLSMDGGGVMCEDVGQLCSIAEYNAEEKDRKIRAIHGLTHTRKVKALWNAQIYVHHSFAHPLYNQYIHEEADRQLAI